MVQVRIARTPGRTEPAVSYGYRRDADVVVARFRELFAMLRQGRAGRATISIARFQDEKEPDGKQRTRPGRSSRRRYRPGAPRARSGRLPPPRAIHRAEGVRLAQAPRCRSEDDSPASARPGRKGTQA